jgi:tetratricopeptide (TPR) repeat protein
MSEDDRGTKPPTRPGAGASGPPASIGKALGGDLDFEPDALLDSLMQDEPTVHPPPRRPPVDSQPPLEAELTADELDSIPPETAEGESTDRETLRPSDTDDEEPTLIGHRDQLFESGHLPAPPARANLPTGPDSSTATPLMHRPPPSTQSIPGRRPAGALGLRQPPVMAPRPAAGSPALPARPEPTRPAVPRPVAPRPQGTAPAARAPMLSEGSIPTAPPPPLESSPALEAGDDEDAPESQRTSLTDDEIAALEELESLSPPSESEPPTASHQVPSLGSLPKISSPPTSVSFGSQSSLPPSLRPSSQVPRPSSGVPRPASSSPRAASQAPRLASQFPRVEPGATLPKPGHPDEWTQRAEWIEAEARRISDAPGRSRALVVASEIWALAGNLERARTAAQDANTAARAGMAGRQLRWLAAAAGDWKLVASTLELELRGAPPSDARAHASYLDAEVQRLCLADDAAAVQRFDAALRSEPDDPRPHLAKLGTALGTSAAPPSHALPETMAESPLGVALDQSRRLRAGDGDPVGQGPIAAFGIARRALGSGKRLTAASALAEIGKVDGLGDGAAWLANSLLAEEPSARDDVLRRTATLATGADPRLGRRVLAMRALERGDTAVLASALEPVDDTFSAAERLAIAALMGQTESVPTLAADVADGEYAALGAAALAANNQVTPEAGSDESRAEAALGRALARAGGDLELERLTPALQRFGETHPGTLTSTLLALELATVERRHSEVAATLGAWGESTGDQPPARDRALARALVSELAGDLEDARAAYTEAGEADPSFEAALRARLGVLDVEAQGAALAELATASHDSTHGAVLLLEAALKLGGADARRADEWLKRAITLDSALALAFRAGEQQARAAADAERLAEWLRARREVTNDDVERALDLVREALLLADTQPVEAQALLELAIQAHPGDVGLRELHERLGTSAHGSDRGAWREAAAEHASEATRVLLELHAAFEYERAGDRASAARLAARAASAGGALARLTAERTAAGTPEAARVAEDLLNRARAATDPREQRELYEALSDLDRERGDAASVLLWQTAIVEQSPRSLPALRQLEQAYASAGRDEDLEPVATTIARALTDLEGFAHARIGARLRAKAGAWASQRELVELAAERNPASIWALRSLAAHARAADEPERAMDAHQRLQALVEHPLDKATLALRGAEAAARLGRFEQAKAQLEACLELVPDHWVGLTTLSEVLEALRDYAGAARALETVAESSTVDAHRVSAWHQAAVLWLDKVNDVERGRAALEHAIALDPEHEDAMGRLQQLLIDQGDRQALAHVLGRRLELATDPEERIALEVQRGKLLAGVGEHAAARSALSAALDANPEHAGALEALADLSATEGDWSAAEQALIRLARHTPEPARQAQIYRRLGELYDTNLPNPERAELAYQEVLKREPDDEPASLRLVQIAGQLGQANRAIELQTGLVDRAKSPAEKRDRTLGLGVVLEQIAKDKKRADAVFERARKDWPQDTTVLRAAVEYLRRSGEQRPAQVLVDRAATDARRALATGRFDPILFEMLGAVAELRGASDAALVAEATLAALAGRPLAVHGAGNAVARPDLDELLAPDVITQALRTLLLRAGDVLDQAYGLDQRTLRAQPLPVESAALGEQARELAAAFGIQGLEVLVSPVLGATCLATRSVPPQIVYGTALIERGDDATRYFLLVRALKLIQARAATLARTVPTELGPVVTGFLSALADYNPEGVDPKRLADAQKRVKAAIQKPLANDIPMLALEVVGSLGSRSSQLATALNQWANRTALLAVGSPLTALRALALASSAELPAEGPDRLRWLGRHAEARDLAIFSVTDAYGEARKRLGVVG